MRFSCLLAAFAVCTGAIAQGTGNGTQINTDITNIASQLNVLESSLNSFTGTTVQALGILSETNKLQTIIKKAGTDAKASPALTTPATIVVVANVVSLQVNIYSTLSTLVAKYPQFQQATFNTALISNTIVKNSLTQLKNATDTFGNNLNPKLLPSVQNLAPFLVGDIDFHFSRAIHAFSTL